MDLPILLALVVSLLIIAYLAFTAFVGGSKDTSENRATLEVQNHNEGEMQQVSKFFL